jgi:site-specific recombinase XerC
MNISDERPDYYFQIYLRECSTLRGASPHTIRSYKLAYKRFGSVGHPTDIESAKAAVMALRDQGVAPSSINAYIRSYAAFLNWMVARGGAREVTARFHIPRLPVPKTIKPVFDSDQALAVLRSKPTELGERRALHMFAVALDTALRFGELVSIRRVDVDARNNLVAVSGKTGERRVPVSTEGLRWLS